jgi:hypothetical protein
MRRGLKLVAAAALGLSALLLGKGHVQAHPAYTTLARITYYTESGYTASGLWTEVGYVACSYDLPLGTEVLINGDAYFCEDRGMLSPTWIDIYCPYDCGWIPASYGSWAEIEVLG